VLSDHLVTFSRISQQSRTGRSWLMCRLFRWGCYQVGRVAPARPEVPQIQPLSALVPLLESPHRTYSAHRQIGARPPASRIDRNKQALSRRSATWRYRPRPPSLVDPKAGSLVVMERPPSASGSAQIRNSSDLEIPGSMPSAWSISSGAVYTPRVVNAVPRFSSIGHELGTDLA
jgi:hypothetical protein